MVLVTTNMFPAIADRLTYLIWTRTRESISLTACCAGTETSSSWWLVNEDVIADEDQKKLANESHNEKSARQSVASAETR